MIDGILGWLKRRSENSQVTYSRFGLPGDDEDERLPPRNIYVAHFDDDARKYRAFFTHCTRGASVAAKLGLSCLLFSFVIFLFKFRWNDHGRGFDVGTFIGSILLLVIGVTIHWQVLMGIKRETPMHLVPAIIVYTYLLVVELIIFLMAAKKIINSTDPKIKNKRTIMCLTLSVLSATILGVQFVMLVSFYRARKYYEHKELHRKQVQVAEHGKRQNPQMQIVYVKATEQIDPMADSDTTVVTSPPPRVILAANDDIA